MSVPGHIEDQTKNEVSPELTKPEKINHGNNISTESTQVKAIEKIVNIKSEEIELHQNISSKENTQYEKVEPVEVEPKLSSDDTQDVAMKETLNDKVIQDSPNTVCETNTQSEEIKSTDNYVIADRTQDVEMKPIEDDKVSQDSPNVKQETTRDKMVYKVLEDNTESEKVKPAVNEISANDGLNIEIKQIENDNLIVADTKVQKVSKHSIQSDKLEHFQNKESKNVTQEVELKLITNKESKDVTNDVEMKQIENKESEDVRQEVELKLITNKESKDVTQGVEMKKMENDKVSQDKPVENTVFIGSQEIFLNNSKNKGNAIVNNVTLSQTQTEPEVSNNKVSQNIQETIVLGESDECEPKKHQIIDVENTISEENVDMRQIENDKMTQDNKVIEKTKQSPTAEIAGSELCKNKKSTPDKRHIKKSEVTITSKNSLNSVSENATIASKNSQNKQHKEENRIDNVLDSDVSLNEMQESELLSSMCDDSSDDETDQAVDAILDGIDIDELTRDEEDIEAPSEPQIITPMTTTQVENIVQGPTPINQELTKDENGNAASEPQISIKQPENNSTVKKIETPITKMQVKNKVQGPIPIDQECTKDKEGKAASKPQTTTKQPENKSTVKKIETPIAITQVENKVQGSAPMNGEPVLKCHCPTLQIRNYPRGHGLMEIKHNINSFFNRGLIYWLRKITQPIDMGRDMFDGLLLEFVSLSDCEYAFKQLKNKYVMGSKIVPIHLSDEKKMEAINCGINFTCHYNKERVQLCKQEKTKRLATSAESKTDTFTAHTSVTKKETKIEQDIDSAIQNKQQKVVNKNVNVSDVSQNDTQVSELSMYDNLSYEEDLEQGVDESLDCMDPDELTEDDKVGEAASELQTNEEPENAMATTQVDNKLERPSPTVPKSFIRCLCPTLQIRNFPVKLKTYELKNYIRSYLEGQVDFWLHIIEKPVNTGKFSVDGILLEFQTKFDCNFAYTKLKNKFMMGSKIAVFHFKEYNKKHLVSHGGPNFECHFNKMQGKASKRTLPNSVGTPEEIAAKKFKSDKSVAQAVTVTNNKTTASQNIESDTNNPFPVKGIRLRTLNLTASNDTYGLSLEYLDRLGIRPPLTHKIRVTEVNPLVTLEHKKELKEIFRMAGYVTDIFVARKQASAVWFVDYKHPLEAVQAVSMFHCQKICGSEVHVRMCPSFGINLPPGLESIGPGLGLNGLPLPYAAQQIDMHPVKRAIRELGKHTTGDEDVLKNIFDLGPNYQSNAVIYNQQPTQSFHNQQSDAQNDGNAQNAANQQKNYSNAANMTDPSTALLSALMTQLKDNSLSNDTAASLQEQLMKLAEMIAQKTHNNQSQTQVQNQPTFTPNQLPSSSGIQSQYAASPPMQSPVIPNYNPYQNQVNAGLEWNTNSQTNTVAPPLNPYADVPMASMFNQALVQQQLQMNAAMQQFQLSSASQQQIVATQQQINLNPATASTLNALTQQTMLNPQWALQQTNMNVAAQNLNPAITQQQNMNPEITQQQNLNPAITTQQYNLTSQQILQQHNQVSQPQKSFPTFVPQNTEIPKPQSISSASKKYGAEPVTYKNEQKNSQIHVNIKRPAYEPQKHQDTLNFGNLPKSVTCQALLTKMKEVGDVMFCEMISQGRAMVRFKHYWDAEKCFKLFNLSKVDGQVIEVKFVH